MILSASRRTDIPAFYSDWFYRRVKEGRVCVRNPLNPHQVSEIPITPEVVDCIVFWTKDPAPMLDRLEELGDYMYYSQYTLNAYDRRIEPRVPDMDQRLETFRRLAERLGKERVIWRYDPILLTGDLDPDYHARAFRRIAEELKGCTEKAVISFVDVYPARNKKALEALGTLLPGEDTLRELAGRLAEGQLLPNDTRLSGIRSRGGERQRHPPEHQPAGSPARPRQGGHHHEQLRQLPLSGGPGRGYRPVHQRQGQ